MKRSWPLFAALFTFSVLGSSGSAEAGLFDFLFGNPAPAPAPYYPGPPRDVGYAPQRSFDSYRHTRKKTSRRSKVTYSEARAKSRRAERSTERWSNGIERVYAFVDKPSPEPARDLLAIRKLSDVARERGFQAAFMEDPTLRSGDILVTQVGIVVFEGSDTKRENNFRPLSKSRLKNRADLALLQKISGFGPPRIALPATDAMPPLVIQQRGKRPKADPAVTEPPKVDKTEPVKIEIANPQEAAVSQ